MVRADMRTGFQKNCHRALRKRSKSDIQVMDKKIEWKARV